MGWESLQSPRYTGRQKENVYPGASRDRESGEAPAVCPPKTTRLEHDLCQEAFTHTFCVAVDAAVDGLFQHQLRSQRTAGAGGSRVLKTQQGLRRALKSISPNSCPPANLGRGPSLETGVCRCDGGRI